MNSTRQEQEQAYFEQIGNQACQKEEYLNAIEIFTQAIDLNHHYYKFYAKRAGCYFALKKYHPLTIQTILYLLRYEKCIEDCTNTLCIDKNIHEAWAIKGVSYAFLSRFEDAKICLDKAKKIDPSIREYQDHIDCLLTIEQDFQSVLKFLANNDYSTALRKVEDIRRVYPNLIIAKIKHIELLLTTGKTKEALQMSDQLSDELNSNSQFLYVKGLALYHNGQPDRAKKNWEEALEINVNNEELNTALSMIKEQKEYYNKGNEAFKKGQYYMAMSHYFESIYHAEFNTSFVITLHTCLTIANFMLNKYSEAVSNSNIAINIAIAVDNNFGEAYFWRAQARWMERQYQEAIEDFTRAQQLDLNRNRISNDITNFYYEILDNEKISAIEEVKKIFNPGKVLENDDFETIHKASSILSQDKKLKKYDQSLNKVKQKKSANFDSNPSQIFYTFVDPYSRDETVYKVNANLIDICQSNFDRNQNRPEGTASKFDFFKIDRIKAELQDSLVDLVAVIAETKDLETVSRQGESLRGKEIFLADDTGLIKLTLWENRMAQFENTCRKGTLLALIEARVDYNYKGIVELRCQPKTEILNPHWLTPNQINY